MKNECAAKRGNKIIIYQIREMVKYPEERVELNSVNKFILPFLMFLYGCKIFTKKTTHYDRNCDKITT